MKAEFADVYCKDLSKEGYGIADIDGYVIFVKGLLPDEEAGIKIIKKKKNYAIGIIDELFSVSPDRIQPICKVSYKCGSCDLQHINYSAQLKFKEQFIKGIYVDNYGFNLKILPIIPAKEIYYYRSKIQIPVKDNKFGYYRNNSNDIVEFDKCFLHTKESQDLLNYVKKVLIQNNLCSNIRHIIIREGHYSKEVMLAFVVKKRIDIELNKIISDIINKFPKLKSVLMNINKRKDNVILSDETICLYGRNYIYDSIHNITFPISLKSFFQIHVVQAEQLYKTALDMAELDSEAKVLDLYCGIGTISLFVAKKVNEVTGVEIVGDAIKDAIKAAELNNINNVKFYCRDAKENLDDLLSNKDIVFVDPPRKGLEKEVLDAFIRSGINKILYISCNPITQARDINYLKKYYNINEVQAIDMFPMTKHVEAVVLMSRVKD